MTFLIVACILLLDVKNEDKILPTCILHDLLSFTWYLFIYLFIFFFRERAT